MFVHFTMTAAACGCLEKQFVDVKITKTTQFLHL